MLLVFFASDVDYLDSKVFFEGDRFHRIVKFSLYHHELVDSRLGSNGWQIDKTFDSIDLLTQFLQLIKRDYQYL